MNADQLARLVGGELLGPNRSFVGVAPLWDAGPTHVAYAERPTPNRAGVLIAREPPDTPEQTVVRVDDPKRAFIILLNHLFPQTHPIGVHPGAFVDPSARLGARVCVYPGAWIGAECEIGDDTVVFPNVVVYPRTRIGRRCRIHAGAVLGADGFSYHPTEQGLRKVPHLGRLIIEDDVEIGANTTVDRAFLGETRLGASVKLDNLVHVGHNTTVGASTVIAAQSGISGSCRIGAGCQIGGQVGVADHATVGDGAKLGARAGAHGRLAGGQTYLGVPAIPVRIARRTMATMRHLPEMWRRLQRLQQAVDKVVENLHSKSNRAPQNRPSGPKSW